MLLGLALSICNPQPSGEAAFDPATLDLTGWWQAPYTYASAADPWVGTASAGNSGSHALGYNGAPQTRTGYALNGLEGMGGDGHFESLFDNVNGYTVTTFISRTAYSGWFLLKPGTPNDDGEGIATAYPSYAFGAPAEPGDARGQRGIVQDGSQTKFSINYDENGVTLCHVDTGGLKTVTVALAIGTTALIQYGFTGSEIWIQKNGDAMVTLAAGAIQNPFDGTGSFHIMDAWTTAHFGGVIWDIGVSQQDLQAQRDNVRAYINDRYALSL